MNMSNIKNPFDYIFKGFYLGLFIGAFIGLLLGSYYKKNIIEILEMMIIIGSILGICGIMLGGIKGQGEFLIDLMEKMQK